MTSQVRRVFLSFLTVLALMFGLAAMPASAQENTRYASIVIDAESGEELFSRFASERRYPASLTKIMTLYLAFEAMNEGRARPTDILTISAHAASQPPSKLGLYAGQTITLDDAMKATAVRSANDMAVAIAEHIGGSEANFAAAMTRKARELGMSSTRYVNANGLPDSRQITTVRDLALLSRAVMRDFPQYYSYFGLHDWVYNGRTYRNTNGLLASIPGYDGMKTGYINASGYNLSASAVRDGRRLITIVLGGRTSASRNAHVAELMDTGFEVARRRSQGERIQTAQAFFEQRGFGIAAEPASAPVAYASLDSSSATPYAPTVAPPATPAPAPAPARRSSTEVAYVAGPVVAPPSQVRPSPSERTLEQVLAANSRDAAAAQSRGVQATATAPANVTASLNGAPFGTPLASAPASATTSSRATTSSSRQTASRQPARAPAGRWAVQVGAFRDETVARNWLTEINRRFRSEFANSERQVQTAGDWYRSRFTGLTEDGAKAACEALAARRVTCAVIRPS